MWESPGLLLCQTIEHVIEDMKFALAHLLFTIARRHTQ